MIVQIIDAIVVLHRHAARAVRDEHVLCAQPVLHDEERLLPAVIEAVEHEPQPLRVDLPAPFACPQIRVLLSAEDVAAARRAARTLADADVVAERNKVHRVLPQKAQFLLRRPDLDAVLTEVPFHIAGVHTAYVHIAEEVVEMFCLHDGDHVVGRGGQRIRRHREDHAADLGVRDDLMPDLDCACRGDELMMARLIEIRQRQPLLRRHDAAREQRLVQHGVDLIERQPVFYFIPIARKDRAHIAFVEVDEVVAHPAIVCFREVERRLVVRDRDERLDAVSQALVKEIVVELQPRLVRLCIVPVRIDAAPRNRRAQHLKPHLGKESDVLPIPMVKVNRRELQVVCGRCCRRRPHDAMRHDVLNVESLAVRMVCALALICGDRPAPEEILRKCHTVLLPHITGKYFPHRASLSMRRPNRRIQKDASRGLCQIYHSFLKAIAPFPPLQTWSQEGSVHLHGVLLCPKSIRSGDGATLRPYRR